MHACFTGLSMVLRFCRSYGTRYTYGYAASFTVRYYLQRPAIKKQYPVAHCRRSSGILHSTVVVYFYTIRMPHILNCMSNACHHSYARLHPDSPLPACATLRTIVVASSQHQACSLQWYVKTNNGSETTLGQMKAVTKPGMQPELRAGQRHRQAAAQPSQKGP